jgi:hypothetical protein
MGDLTSTTLGSGGFSRLSRALPTAVGEAARATAGRVRCGASRISCPAATAAPDPDAVLSALHFEFRNPRFGSELNQLTYLIDSH